MSANIRWVSNKFTFCILSAENENSAFTFLTCISRDDTCVACSIDSLRSRTSLATMTCKASNARCSSELRVCVPNQLNHFTGGLLLRLIVLLKLVLYVAIGAVNAKRGFKRKHNLHQPIGRKPSQQLDVFVFLFRALFFTSSWKRIKGGELRWCAGRSAGFSAARGSGRTAGQGWCRNRLARINWRMIGRQRLPAVTAVY